MPWAPGTDEQTDAQSPKPPKQARGRAWIPASSAQLQSLFLFTFFCSTNTWETLGEKLKKQTVLFVCEGCFALLGILKSAQIMEEI